MLECQFFNFKSFFQSLFNFLSKYILLNFTIFVCQQFYSMDKAGFKFSVPFLVSYKEHLDGLVCSCIEETASEMFCFFHDGKQDIIKIKSAQGGFDEEFQNSLKFLLHWTKEVLDLNNHYFKIDFRNQYTVYPTSYYSGIIFSLFQLSKSREKPDYLDLVNRGYEFLLRNSFDVDRLFYYTYMLGGTRFDIGDVLNPVRVSFPKGYRVLLVKKARYRGPSEIEAIGIDSKKVLSLYHGLFFSDWKAICFGIQSFQPCPISGTVQSYIEEEKCNFIQIHSDYLCFIFPNSLLSSDFLEGLTKTGLLEPDGITDFIISKFSTEGIRLC